MLNRSGGSFFTKPSIVAAPPSNFGTSWVGSSPITRANAATISMPTHLAPTGSQKDFFIGSAIWTGSTALPTFDATEGWTQLVIPSDGLGAGIGSNSAQILFAKFATSSSEAFGTHTNATRVAVIHGRCTNAPATIGALIGAISFDNKASGASNLWVGLALEEALAHVFTFMLSRLDQAAVNRSDTIYQNGASTGSNRVLYATSNGSVASWAQQDVTAGVPGSVETQSVAVEVLP